MPGNTNKIHTITVTKEFTVTLSESDWFRWFDGGPPPDEERINHYARTSVPAGGTITDIKVTTTTEPIPPFRHLGRIKIE